MNTNIDRARSYLAKLPVSVTGERGHAAAYRAACVLIQTFYLTQDEAFDLMREWNRFCIPPWSESDLRHKIHDARQATPTACVAAGNIAKGAWEDPDESRVRPPLTTKRWPTFCTLDSDEVGIVAEMRQVSIEAVHLVATARLIGSTMYQGHRCVVMGEGSFAQLMRFDGEELSTRAGRVRKKNLPGAKGSFIGATLLDSSSDILLVEGAFGLIEAVAAVLLADPPKSWTVLAATSASSRFGQSPDLLCRLKGRRISIVADHDEAGFRAASSWLEDLQSVGCHVRVFSDPNTKDLGPLVAEPAKHLSTLRSLFS